MTVRSELSDTAGTAASAAPVAAVIFDLDGVLVDSFAVMREAFCIAYAEVVGPEPAPFHEYNRHLGRFFPDIMRIMGLPLEMEEPFVRESYRLADRVRLFPGIADLLAELRVRNIPLAVATGKEGNRARSLLEGLGVLGTFHRVIGSDEIANPKPAPDILLRALELLDVAAHQALFVGDAVTDLRSARGAQVRSVAALWGTTNKAALLAEGPDVVADSPIDLLQLIRTD